MPELDLNDNTEHKPNEELLSEEEEDQDEISSEGNDYDSESSVDDSDLLKRLDEKYGKLPHHSDEEDDEPDYDVDVDGDRDEDDEDIDPTWTSTYLTCEIQFNKTNIQLLIHSQFEFISHL